jgi:hypothetical protein
MDIRSKQTDARIAEAVARRVQDRNLKDSFMKAKAANAGKQVNPQVAKVARRVAGNPAYANAINKGQGKKVGLRRRLAGSTTQPVNVPERTGTRVTSPVIRNRGTSVPVNAPERFKNYGQAKKAMRLRKSKINLQAAAKMRLAASRRSK